MNAFNGVLFLDIGSNLTDSMYQGEYHGSKKHEADLKFVLARAWENGMHKMMVTGGSLEESERALALVKWDDRLFSTVGCHPTRCNQFEETPGPEVYLDGLKTLVEENRGKVVALGEMGLDYDRTQFCDKETQKK